MEAVYFHAAECALNCDDPQCPYTHSDSWIADGVWFDTEAEAVASRLPTPASPKRERYSDMAEAINRGVK